MYTRIAVGVDHSECSPYALEQALSLAASEEAELILISVIPGYDGDLRLMGNTSILETMREPYVAALEDACQQADRRRIPYTRVLLSGEPAEELLNTIEAQRADLVVIGKKASRVMHLIPIGSVSAKLLKLSPIDVLVVPCGKQLDLSTLLVAFDGSKHASEAAAKACTLALRYGSTYLLSTIYEMSLEGYVLAPEISTQLHSKAAKLQEPIVAMLRERGVRHFERLVEHGDPVFQGLSELARKKDAGLAVLGSRGTGSLARVLLGSVAARFISTGVCPTLVVKT
ncbi:MAG: universal stress protein [Desulfofustis sp. PB-SRB1]|jgi:nucleotide-binding universal stress UspA family protein|nr:universal stress protein [Desulfofustis sp. PB-SRB1]MBM1003613.1 universal stress protein [Desulfofustis sp. PB-SRB1]HBH29787.1 universal stress protein [Desulfofustis sp.]HBH32732.1 universal stress protein [Desulfofustis sp.]